MEKSKRKANDGQEQETDMQMMGKSKRQASDGEERETGGRVMGNVERNRQVIENIEQETE